jgi:hypothetical protein
MIIPLLHLCSMTDGLILPAAHPLSRIDRASAAQISGYCTDKSEKAEKKL